MCRVPSICPDGPWAHRPRQNTSATSTSSAALQRFVALAVDLLDDDLGPAGLQLLAATQADAVRDRGSAPEVVVEGHDPVHVGPGEVEDVGDDGDVVVVDVAVSRDDRVEDGQQRAAQVGELLGNGSHGCRPGGVCRGRCCGWGRTSLTHDVDSSTVSVIWVATVRAARAECGVHPAEEGCTPHSWFAQNDDMGTRGEDPVGRVVVGDRPVESLAAGAPRRR